MQSLCRWHTFSREAVNVEMEFQRYHLNQDYYKQLFRWVAIEKYLVQEIWLNRDGIEECCSTILE